MTTVRNIVLLAFAGALLSGCYAHVYHPGPTYYGYYEQPRAYGYGHGYGRHHNHWRGGHQHGGYGPYGRHHRGW
ncbi:MAG TPA: neuropeptide-like protein 29 [Azospirillum sp.]|nr:neuropeptide-like protein 29 [Azospirillum sp.]